MDDLGSTECLRSPGWWLCLLGVSTNYLMHGFIWNYPSRFSALCQKAPLKILGGHPVDVFASLEVVAKIIQGCSLLAFLGNLEHGVHGAVNQWALKALNVATYNAIGNAGVYYGFKLGRTVPWCYGFPFNTGLRHPQSKEMLQMGLPQLVLTWGSMYGIMSAMEQAGDNEKIVHLQVDDADIGTPETEGDWRSALNALTRRARSVLLPGDSESLTVPLASRPSDSAQTDVEMHDRLGAWARHAQQNLSQGLQHARTIDWTQQVAPTIGVRGGEWTRFRIVYAGWLAEVLNFDISGCEKALLAKDGIYIRDFPRMLSGYAPIPVGGRADLMVRCMAPHTEYQVTWGAERIATVSTGELIPSSLDLEAWSPRYPAYLEDLQTTETSPDCSCVTELEGRTVNGHLFEEDFILHESYLGAVVERAITARSHPFQKVSDTASAAGSSLSEQVSQGVERAKSVDWSARAEAGRPHETARDGQHHGSEERGAMGDFGLGISPAVEALKKAASPRSVHTAHQFPGAEGRLTPLELETWMIF
eukprot:g12374.t1